MDVALDKEFLQSFNVSSLKKLVDWEQVEKISQNNNLQPESALALASFIGMMMMAQQYSMSRKGSGPTRGVGGMESLQDRTGYNRKRRRRKRVKKLKKPRDHREDDFKQNYWVKNIDFDYNYPDFYDDKNYEYIDDEDVEKIQLNLESNRKISDDGEEVEFNFEKIDYDNYEFDDVGLLNFNKPPHQPLPEKQLSKRRFRPLGVRRPAAAALVRRRRPPPYSVGLVKIKPRVGTSPFLQSMGSVFDFPSMLAVAGFWFVWQNYLVNLVPTTVLSDFVSSLGRSSDRMTHQQILESLQTFMSEQQLLSNKEAVD